MGERGVVVDVETHLYPPAYLDALRVVAAGAGRSAVIAQRTLDDPLVSKVPLFSGAIEERLKLMDAAGVDLHVLSFPAPNVWSDDVDVRRRVTEAFNDGCAEVAREHPGRFALLATLPVPHLDAAVTEAERALDQLGAAGVCLCTHFDGRRFDDPGFAPLFKYLDERRTAVLLHPEGFPVPGVLEDHGMEWALGAPFDDTMAAVRLIYAGLLDRYPSIQWIVPHLGGTLPFLAGRLDFVWRLIPALRDALPEPPSAHLGRLWLDTANPDPRAIALAADVIGAGRLLYASDFPFAGRTDLTPGLAALAQAGLAGLELAAARGGNAAAILARDRPEVPAGSLSSAAPAED